MDNQEQKQSIEDSKVDEFFSALREENYHKCTQILGVLDSIGYAYTDSLNGIMFQMKGEYSKALEFYSRINSHSPMYDETQQSIAYIYMITGDYLRLDEILHSTYKCTPIEALDLRIQCLGYASAAYCVEHEKDIRNSDVSMLEAKLYSGEDAETFFGICNKFVQSLIGTVLCMEQCAVYQERQKQPLIEFSENEDTKHLIDEYTKFCIILELSKLVGIIRFSEQNMSLATVALCDKKWGEKLLIIRTKNYIQQVVQIVFTLCRPETHPNYPRLLSIEMLLHNVFTLSRTTIAQLIDHYFDEVSQAYGSENSNVKNYIEYVYAEILANGNDRFGLKERIEGISKRDPKTDSQKMADKIRFYQSLSWKGKLSLNEAEAEFREEEKKPHGTKDYSGLALKFFRVIEIEYSEKLIIPLTQSVDINQLRALIVKCSDDERRKKWESDCKCLQKISDGVQDSLQLGMVRTLLSHLVNNGFKSDDCAKYFSRYVDSILTNAGKKALQNRDMLNVIDNSSIDQYRTPGAHTGFLPFSEAKQARDYVEVNLPIIETWFM